MNLGKTLSLALISLLILSFSAAEADIGSIEINEDTLNPGDDYQIEFETSADDGTEVDVTEIIEDENGVEVRNEEVTVTIGEEEQTIPYIRELETDNQPSYFSEWALDIKKDGSSNFEDFQVEPHQTLTEISKNDDTDIVTPENEYEDIAEDLEEEAGGIVSLEDFDEDYKDENDEIVLVGEPSEINIIEELGENSEELSVSEDRELLVANIQTEEIRTIIVSGQGEIGIQNSKNILDLLINGELEDNFNNDAAATLTEEEYSDVASEFANIGLSPNRPDNPAAGEPIDFDNEITNNEDFDFSGELFVQHKIFEEESNETLEINIDSDSSSTYYFDDVLEAEYQPGENQLLVEVRSDEGSVLDSYSESFDVAAEEVENALEPRVEIIDPDFDSSVELDTEVENLMDEEIEVKRNTNHSSEGETISEVNETVSFSASSTTSNSYSLENNTVEGNNTVEVRYLYEEDEDSFVEIGFAKDNTTVERPDGPGVSLSISSFEESLEVGTQLGDYETFADEDLELEYLKDDTLIFRESILIEEHESQETWTYTHSELESEIGAVTGDSSIFGEHTFRADILGAEGSSEETVEISPEDIEETLETGWNMVSGELTVSELRNDCDIVEFNGEPLWSYRGGEWYNPDSLSSVHGYYVHVESGCTTPLEESSTDIDFVSDETLGEGWNMISTLEHVSFEDLETNCEPVENSDEEIVWQYQPGDNEWETFDEEHELKPFEGYFIKTEETCTIEHTEHN